MATAWQPSATMAALQTRAAIIQSIRQFFHDRGVTEVETPLLCHTSVTDPFIQSIPASVHLNGQPTRFYLQTSPEYAMKRLLAAGSGAIYQICKAFRQEEIGRMHNPEFTMLEWYRPGFDHHQLMDEMDALLQYVLKTSAAKRYTYAGLFQERLQIDPHYATVKELVDCAKQNHLIIQAVITDRDTWLQLLMSHCIEPTLGVDAPCFVYDFPASQAALARVQAGPPPVASRFEVYYRGIELANGFHELADPIEQRKRFEDNNIKRHALQLETLPIDELFLSALEHGLPDCAGVALGVDRLIMLAMNKTTITDIMSFDITKA